MFLFILDFKRGKKCNGFTMMYDFVFFFVCVHDYDQNGYSDPKHQKSSMIYKLDVNCT